MKEFTHFDKEGKAIMVDVSKKKDSEREAIASGKITLSREAFQMVKAGDMKKGDVLGIARISAIMGAKKTWELIPLCHILNLSKVSVEFNLKEEDSTIELICTVKTVGKTGVEMEALTGVNVGLLTIYDMCKAVDKSMVISDVMLLKKTGGKSGVWER